MLNILAVFAHPDDETMLCGGTLALLSRQGACIHYLCATRGEGGDVGEPPVGERKDLGIFRSRELECAVQALKGCSLSFLDYVDPLVGPGQSLFAFTDNLEKLAGEIQTRILETHADCVITHGSNGEYGHPAHVLTHQACLEAVKGLNNPSITLYTVQASFTGHPKPRMVNKDDSADMVINVEPVKSEKIQATLCHKSQHALFVRNTSRDLGRPVSVPEVVVTTESLHQVHWDSNTRSGDVLFELLRNTGLVIQPALEAPTG